jgi:phage baseplate assembly protein W
VVQSYGYRPELGLGLGVRGLAEPDEALAQRIQLVLATRPGDLPWKPEFGTDLAQLVGNPVSGWTHAQAKHAIRGALAQWVPEAGVESIRVSTQVRPSPGFQPVGPIERALVPAGMQATIIIDLVIETEDGPAAMTLEVDP